LVKINQMADRKREILATAYGLMGTKGLESVHARTVATEIGINHATVHYYFKTRSDLLCGIADFALNILAADRGRFQEGAETDTERLENELALAEAYCRKQSRFMKVLIGLSTAAIGDPAVKKRLKVLWDAWVAGFSTPLPGAKALKGSQFADVDTLVAALFGTGIVSHLTDGSLDGANTVAKIQRSLLG
jgi:AcrR family transcriptional regulator